MSESSAPMRGDERLSRAIGAGISAGLATYVIAFWGNSCADLSEDIKLVATFLVCPLTALVFSLPRFSLGSYWRNGLAAGLGLVIGLTWAATDRETCAFTETAAPAMILGWVPALGGLALGMLLVQAARGLERLKSVFRHLPPRGEVLLE